MSQCHLCGTPDTATVLIKCQWYGRGTKWLCIQCVRTVSGRETTPSSAKPRSARAVRGGVGREVGPGTGHTIL
jgi:hypothetical protein